MDPEDKTTIMQKVEEANFWLQSPESLKADVPALINYLPCAMRPVA